MWFRTKLVQELDIPVPGGGGTAVPPTAATKSMGGNCLKPVTLVALKEDTPYHDDTDSYSTETQLVQVSFRIGGGSTITLEVIGV